MPRLALLVEYCGTEFHGWQKQPELSSVQGVLEGAISQMVQHPVTTVAAGRTDSGVHALGMVVHVDTTKEYSPRSFVFGLNHFLPQSIRVHQVCYVDESFHARYSAISRRYQYVILNAPTNSSLLQNRVLWHPIRLDAELMGQAASLLAGQQDFSSLRGRDCQAKSPVRNIHFCHVRRVNDLIILDIQADGFLHHMVRNIVGVLLKVGEGEREVSWVSEVLAAKDRTMAAMNVPARGLYFCEVSYPEHFALQAFVSSKTQESAIAFLQNA